MSARQELLRPERVLGPSYRRLSLGILSVVALIAFEAMAVATAMPVAVRDLQGLPLYAWGFSGFFAASLYGMVVAGELCDTRGPGLALWSGIAAFGTGLVLSGLATTMWAFVAGRAVQGLGAGAVIVALYVVVARCYPDDLRPRVFALMSSAWVLPSIVGPPIAGWLADHLSWRLVFLAVAPFVVPAVVLLAPWLRPGEGSRGPGGLPRTGRKRRALAAALGVATLQYAGQDLGWHSLALGAVAAALLVASVPRLLPVGTLRTGRGLPTVVALRGLLAGGFFGAEAFVPLMLVTERSLSTTLAGLSLTGAALGWATGAWWQGRPGLRTPRWRLVQIGCGLVALSIAAMAATLWEALPAILAAGAWTVSGLGMGLAVSSVSVLLLELSAPAEHGANSAALQISDALGSVGFVGLGGVVYATLQHQAGQDGAAFLTIFAVMAALALLGTLVAPRVRPGFS
jgi:MFS family permease